MTLVIDRRAAFTGQPGLHALIAGVSAYRFLPEKEEDISPRTLGLTQLSSTATSAYKVYCWLKANQDRLDPPLITCRLLLSPSQAELAAAPEMRDLAQGVTLHNFQEEAAAWQKDAQGHEKATFFYFAGHGAQRGNNDAVLLLEDVVENPNAPLENAVAFGNIFNGMADSPLYGLMPKTQFYFIDTCRDFLTAFRNFEQDRTGQVFRVQLSAKDERTCAPVFFAAAPGKQAEALKGEQTLFSKALLACLENDAGDLVEDNAGEHWGVKVLRLTETLTLLINDLNQLHGTDQQVSTTGMISENQVLCWLDQTPMVRVTLAIDPPDALQHTHLVVLDDSGQVGPQIPFPVAPHPYNCTWPAGVYSISAAISPPNPRFVDVRGKARPLLPPATYKRFRMTP